MFKIKKLDLYVLKSFVGILFVTFFICLFILLMQFLWKYVDEMVGKGLDFSVLIEFFSYSALTLVPMALPLAILLASLMTFGNLGERLELLAMKAAGISLFRIIRPLIFTIALICTGAFFFANNVIPTAQTKLWTLIYSMRQKSPEIDIPENVFYNGITGRSFYVRHKNISRNLMEDVMIYDLSKGFENITVTVADSARLQFTDDHMFLVLTLYNGESFENIRNENNTNNMRNIPYRRESFNQKQILIEFDGNFTKMNESAAAGRYMAKNLLKLEHDIDSLGREKDSLAHAFGVQVYERYAFHSLSNVASDTATILISKIYNADSLFASLDSLGKTEAIARAERLLSTFISELSFKRLEIEDRDYNLRRHAIEWHRKFTLSFACLIFFFIGAPLGAIIRKGGLGAPVVISVFLFIIYYIIDNAGFKFAREGVWQTWEGMWLSAAVLLPFGILLTYKAAKDAAILNADAYINFLKKINLQGLYVRIFIKAMNKTTNKLNI